MQEWHGLDDFVDTPIPDIGIKHLNAIVSLARFGSFIAAAAHLGISQPGLSRIIQQAEKKLGAALFERGARTVSLTPAGREFLPFAERMVAELAHQTGKLRAGNAAKDGQLTVASLMSISHLALPAALVEFRRNYPRVFVHIREDVGSAVLEDVRNGVVDFGIGTPDPGNTGISAESVMEEPFFAVLPADHQLARKDVIGLADLRGVPLISMPVESGLRRTIDSAAVAAGMQLDHSVVTNQYNSLFDFVRNGLGVTIAPASTLPPEDDQALVVRSLYPPITRRIAVLRLAERPLSPASEAFLRILRPLLMNATVGVRRVQPLYVVGEGA